MKGSGWLPSMMNFLQGNPALAEKLIVGGLPILAGAAAKLASLFEAPKPPAPAPVSQLRAVPIQRPRAEPAPREPDAVPPSVPPKPGGPWAPMATEAPADGSS